MAEPLNMVITNEGLAALVDAQNGNTNAITISEVALTANDFVVAPTLSAVPGEFKRLSTVSGQAAAANLIHLTASDTSQDIYDVRGVGIFLDDGTLFAVYGQADPIFTKVSIATFLMSLDVIFADAIADAIEFGDSTFLYPPATETTQGVAELATQGETDAGTDDARIVTPLKLKTFVDAVMNGFSAAIDALAARTITGAGLATGGGNLTANRQITVTEASAGDMVQGTRGDRVVTPRRAADLLPAGAVFAFARNTAPAGYLACDGSAVSRATYPALFAAIGVTFGAGDGAETFNLPDLRGEFVRGWASDGDVDQGRVFGSAQADELKSHKHTLPSDSSDTTGNGSVGDSNGTGTNSTASTALTGGSETRPRNIALLYAIKV